MADTSTPSSVSWSDDFAQTLAAQRERVHEFVDDRQRKISQLEAELTAQVAQLNDQLARNQNALSEQQAALAQHREELEAARAKLRGEERLLGQQRHDYEADVEELARQRQRLQEKTAELERQSEAIEDARSQTKSQRRRLAQEFKEKRDKRLREIEQQRADLERAREDLGEAGALAAELNDFRQRCAELESLTADRDQLAAQLAEVQAKLVEADALAAELNELRQRYAELERQLAEQPGRTSDDGSQTAELLAERDRLGRRLEEAEKQLADAESRATEGDGNGDTAKELSDMQRRYQMALDDVRELKKKNAELERQAAGGGPPAAPLAAGGEMDWETQKRQLLAALEANDAEHDDDDEVQKAERLKIRDVIAKTDAVIAAKDEEIAELKQLLDAQSDDSISGMAVGAQAIAELLNQDEVVAAERERLQQLQKEWEEKLRQAEVEMSVQRAKIARERVELEERQRQFQQQQAEQEVDGAPSEGGKGKKPQRGRWLTRLGLKDQDEE